MDEASEALGIPRPTLYRYLREYSVPHVKRSGRISIPGESLDMISRVRDLHREGMGTGSVRRVLKDHSRQTSGDTDISLRLEKLSSDLEGLRVDSPRKGGDELSSAQALRTILARQSLLISAVFNLTEMMEEALRSSGHPLRHSALDTLEERDPDLGNLRLLDDSRDAHEEKSDVAPAVRGRSHRSESQSVSQEPVSGRRDRPTIRFSGATGMGQSHRAEGRSGGGFGALSRRRRRNSWAVTALVLAACAALLVYALMFA